MKVLARPGYADIAAAVEPGLTTVGLYVGITVYLPDRIAALLPAPRPGVRPHITIAHAQVRLEQARRLRHAFGRKAYAVSLADLRPFPLRLHGVGDFRRDATPTPVVFLEVADGAEQLAGLAAAFDAEFGLERRFEYHPHVTLGHGEPDHVLDQIAAEFADFEDEFQVLSLAFTTAHGTLSAPRRITWHQPQTYSLI